MKAEDNAAERIAGILNRYGWGDLTMWPSIRTIPVSVAPTEPLTWVGIVFGRSENKMEELTMTWQKE